MPATQNQPALPLLNPFLGWLPAKYWRRAKTAYVYEAPTIVTVSGAAASVNLTFDSDSDFLCIYQTRVLMAADLVTPVPTAHFTVNIVDSSTGRALSNQPIHLDNFFGVIGNMKEGPLAYPRLINPATVWTITVTDLDATVRNLRLAFHGFKIFPFAES